MFYLTVPALRLRAAGGERWLIMRIGHFNRGLFDPGGTATYVRQISAAQAAMGHEILFYDVVERPGKEFIKDEAAREARAHTTCVHYVRDERDLFDAAQRHKLDALHLHCEIAYTRRPPLPTVRTIHNHQPYCPAGTRFLARSQQICDCRVGPAACLRGHLREHCGSIRPKKMWDAWERTRQEQRFLRYVPAICISEYMKRQMVRAGYSQAQLRVILHAAPPVVAEEPFPPSDEPPRFVYLGRLTPLKGVETLLQAMRHTSASVHLDIAGEGPLEAELRHKSQELGLGSRVRFHGWLASEQTRRLLRQSRALVFPSVWPEPAGLVTLEAGAMSRAVIGTQAGGLPEYALEGQNALLVPPGDALALAAALNRLAADSQLARTMGEQGRRLAREHFTLERHCAQLHQLYTHCAETWNKED